MDNKKNILNALQNFKDTHSFTKTQDTFKVMYQSAFVDMGNELTPFETRHPPHVSYKPYYKIIERDGKKVKSYRYYTLVMVDPDAPNGSFIHWLVVNIKGSNVAMGDHVKHYLGPLVPKKLGTHRYIFILFAQKRKYDYDGDKVPAFSDKARMYEKFSKQVLEVGELEPVAYNYFVAKHDEYVDIASKLMGMDIPYKNVKNYMINKVSSNKPNKNNKPSNNKSNKAEEPKNNKLGNNKSNKAEEPKNNKPKKETAKKETAKKETAKKETAKKTTAKKATAKK